MAALVIAEHDSAGLKPATLNAVAAAKEIAGPDIAIRVAGKDCRLAADPPVASTGGKAVPRTVITLIGSLDWTVCNAFPA